MANRASGDRRRELIDAVINQVVEQGLSATTTNAVGKKAGISKSVIHYHFESMTDLYSAAFDVVMREAGEMMRARVLLEKDSRAKIRQMVWGALPLTEIGRRRATFWFNVLAEALADGRLLQIQNDYTASWLEFVAAEVRHGPGRLAGLSDSESRRLANMIISFADGLTFRMIFGPALTGDELNEAVEDFLCFVLDGRPLGATAPQLADPSPTAGG